MICPGCFGEKGDANLCTNCGYEEVAGRPIYIQYRALLNGRFIVGRNLGKPGGSGVTYLAFDKVLNTQVAIKEYLPTDLATRAGNDVSPNSEDHKAPFEEGLKRFLEEAQILAMFDHPNIVRVKDFFRANGTAYIVMSYYSGMPLDEYIRRKGGKLSEGEALQIALPVLGGLEAVHERNFYHRDIKPQNIYVTTDKTPVLLDFGSARLTAAESGNASVPFVSHGFSPYEQYQKGTNAGPVSDIYGVAATLYYMLTGEEPAMALERVAKDNLTPLSEKAKVSKRVNDAVTAGMAVLPADRPQTIHQFRLLLEGKAAPSDVKGTSASIDHDAPTVALGSAGSGGEPQPESMVATNRKTPGVYITEQGEQPVGHGVTDASHAPHPGVSSSASTPYVNVPDVGEGHPSGRLNVPDVGKRRVASVTVIVLMLLLIGGFIYLFTSDKGSVNIPSISNPKQQKQTGTEPPATGNKPTTMQDKARLLDEATEAFKKGDYNTAVAKAKEVLQIDPADNTAAKIEYKVEEKQKKGASLIADAEQSLNKGQYSIAKKKAEAALKILPGNSKAREIANMADANMAAAKKKEQQKQQQANSSTTLLKEARALSKTDSLPNLKKGKADVEKVLAKEPGNREAQELLMTIDDKIWELELELETLEADRARLEAEIAADKKKQQQYERQIAK